MKKEKRFTTTNGTDVVIKSVNSKIQNEATFVHNKAFSKALKNGSLLRSKLESYMREQGMWGEEEQKKYETILIDIGKIEKKLNSGRDENDEKIKLSEGKELALKLSKLRNKVITILQQKNSLDSSTAEASADNAQFNFFLVKCCYDYKTQKPLFESLEDYLEKGDDETSIEVATEFARHYYDYEPDHDKKRTEFKFLKRFNFIDEEGYYINKDGQRTDSEGNALKDKDETEEEEDVMVAEFEDDINPKPKKTRKKTSTSE
jgi:hypothetical protein